MSADDELQQELSQLSEEQSVVYNQCCTHLFQNTVQITAEWHRIHGNSEGIKYLPVYRQDLLPIMSALHSTYPDEHFWNDYICALCMYDATDTRDMFKRSADLGNPYAAYKYVESLLNAQIWDGNVGHYLHMALNIDHAGAVLLYVRVLTKSKTIYANCKLLNAITERHAFIDKVMQHVSALRRSIDANVHSSYSCRVWLYDLYRSAHECAYPLPDGAVPWLLQSVEYIKYSTDEHTPLVMLLVANLHDEYLALWNRSQQMASTITRLQMLNSMTLDEVCKDVVREYC